METKVMDEKRFALRRVYPDQQVMDEKLSPEPVGLEPFLDACRRFYPDQPQLQFIPELKFWQGGCFPLDYIYVYRNLGNPAEDIAPHLYYIGFGLSDLYGFERVHQVSKLNTRAKNGIELTFRLKTEPDESEVPLWPAYLMQDVAKYAVENNHIFSHGEFSFCGFPFEYSKIKHLLFSEDPQLGTVKTPSGPVTFLQLTGVCEKEFEAAWPAEGRRVYEVMKSVKGAGGPWLVTDMRRDKTIFELDSSVQKVLKTCNTFEYFVYRGLRWYYGLTDHRYERSSKKKE